MAVTDLTNTKWLINSLNCTAGYGKFDLDGDLNNTGYYEIHYFNIGYKFSFDEPYWIPTANYISYTSDPYFHIEVGDIIEITGGTDATNASLISWLTANATQIVEAGKIYIGNSTISKMYIGQNEVEKVYLGQDLVYEKQASGYSVTLDGTGQYTEWSAQLYGYAKFNSSPTAWNDFDAQWGCGYLGLAGTGVTTDNWATYSNTKSFTGVNKIYCWAGDGYGGATGATNKVKINNVDISSNLYNNAYELNVTQDSTFMVQGANEE